MRIFYVVCFISICQSCNKPNADKPEMVKFEKLGLAPDYDSATWHWKWRGLTPSQISNPTEQVKTIFGNRFHITGDFDGDLIEDELTECFRDENNKETHKFIKTSEFGEQVEQIHKRNTQAFLLANKTKIDTLFGQMQSFGFMWVENLGNLNQEEGDELLIVNDAADWSAINSASIYTYCEGKWQPLCTWTIHESWFNKDRASYFKNQVASYNPTLNSQGNSAHEKAIVTFLKTNQIQVKYFGTDVRDSIIAFP